MTEPRRGAMRDVAGRAAHVHRLGAGPAVLLLHGCGSLAEQMLPPFAALAGRFRLIAPDRPGYGFSAALAERPGADGQAAWLAALLDDLDVASAVVVAHSLGAAPALRLAADHPGRVAGLMLVGGFCRPTPHRAMPLLRAAVAPAVGGVIRRALIPGLAPLVGPAMLAHLLRPNPVPPPLRRFPYRHAGRPAAVETMAAELRAFNAVMEETAGRLGRYRGPVVAVHGLCDRTAEPDWHLPWIAGLLPRVRLVRLAGVGHAPHHARPRVVRAELARLAGASVLTDGTASSGRLTA